MKVQLIAKPILLHADEFNVAREDQMRGGSSEALIEFAGRICYDSLGKGRSSTDYHKHIAEVSHGCYDAETDVLTSEGWKNWADVTDSDLLATRTKDGRVEYHHPISLIRYHHSGRMYRVDSKCVDLLVTPNHNMLVCQTTTKEGRKRKDFSLVTAEKLNHASHAYVKSAVWEGGKVSTTEDQCVLALLGFAIGDGYMPQRGFELRFSLRKERKITWLQNVAQKLGWEFDQCGDDKYRVSIPKPFVSLFRSIYDGNREKQIPDSVLFSWDKCALENLMSGLLESDGHRGKTCISYSSTSQKLLGQIQHLALHTGQAANIGYTSTQEQRNSFGIKPLHHLHIIRANLKPEVNKFVGHKGVTSWIENWSGEVFCAEVPNNTLYVRRNGIPVWCGNSVLEHAQFSFLISGVSRNLTHELIRHRVGTAISQRSTRYVDEGDSYIVRHPAHADDPLTGEDDTGETAAYRVVAKEIEAKLLANGVDKGQARKQARAAAARYLPHGLETELVWSANVRALLHVISVRATNEADAEIRQLAVELHRIMQVQVPAYFVGVEVPASDGLGVVITGLRAI